MPNTENSQFDIAMGTGGDNPRGRLASVRIEFMDGGATVTPDYDSPPSRDGKTSPAMPMRPKPKIAASVDSLVSFIKDYASEAGLGAAENEEAEQAEDQGSEGSEEGEGEGGEESGEGNDLGGEGG